MRRHARRFFRDDPTSGITVRDFAERLGLTVVVGFTVAVIITLQVARCSDEPPVVPLPRPGDPSSVERPAGN